MQTSIQKQTCRLTPEYVEVNHTDGGHMPLAAWSWVDLSSNKLYILKWQGVRSDLEE